MSTLDRLGSPTITGPFRQNVYACASSNITLYGEKTIDGVACARGKRVLLIAQDMPSENGPWVVQAGAWIRPKDFQNEEDALEAMFVVQYGSLRGLYKITTNAPIYIGVTGLSVAPLSFTVDLPDGSVTASKLSATAITDKLGYYVATADDLAALQTDFNTLKSIVDPSIVEAGDRLGTLAGLDDIRVEDVGSEFKTILIKDNYNSIISVSSGAGVWIYDNTTPQIGEGNQAWSGSFTPTRSDTIVRVSVDAVVGSASGNAGIALFDSGPNCLVFAPAGQASGGQGPGYVRAVIELPSWGENVAKPFVLRYGGYSGTSYFNSGALGSSMGGSYRSSVLFEEIKRS